MSKLSQNAKELLEGAVIIVGGLLTLFAGRTALAVVRQGYTEKRYRETELALLNTDAMKSAAANGHVVMGKNLHGNTALVIPPAPSKGDMTILPMN